MPLTWRSEEVATQRGEKVVGKFITELAGMAKQRRDIADDVLKRLRRLVERID